MISKEKFKNLFGEIIYSGTLVETEKTFQFQLCDRSMKVSGAMEYQPRVFVRKSELGRFVKVSEEQEPEVYSDLGQELFHDYCYPM